MAKLGESRLGSSQFSRPEPFVPEEEPARERAEEHMKSAFPTEEGTTWDKLLNIILFDAELHNEIIGNIIDQRFVDTATRRQLGMIGEYFGITRRPDESDEHFRARIKSQLPRQTTSTTINEVVRVTTQLLNTNSGRVSVTEPHELEPARFDVRLDDIAFQDTPLSEGDYETLLQEIRAAGVRVVTTVGKQFTYRSEADYNEGINDIDRGYDGLTDDSVTENTDQPNQVAASDGAYTTRELGGGYADEVTSQIY